MLWRRPRPHASNLSKDVRHALLLLRHLQAENRQLADNFENVRGRNE
jgi:hypothetical protein